MADMAAAKNAADLTANQPPATPAVAPVKSAAAESARALVVLAEAALALS